MAHMSENSRKLTLRTSEVSSLGQVRGSKARSAKVFLFALPFGRTSSDAKLSRPSLQVITEFSKSIHDDSTVCVLTTPADAAEFIGLLGDVLKFRHWVVVKTVKGAYEPTTGGLESRHAALLIFTKYSTGLRHTKTRIGYTYCPACGKTTKDYGGKKHLYHEYGTAISDVWRDIEWDPKQGIELIRERLRDFFGLKPYRELRVFDLRGCSTLLPRPLSRPNDIGPNVNSREGTKSGHQLRSRLIHGDCIKVLKSIPSNSVDFCFADLPYNLRKKYYRWKDDIKTLEYFTWCDNWLAELNRVLKPGRTLAVLNIPLWAAQHYAYLSSTMEFQNWIAWDALSFPVRKIMPAHYGILCFSKGTGRPLPGLVANSEKPSFLSSKKEFFCNRPGCVSRRGQKGKADPTELGDLWHDVYRLMHNSQRVSHPCQLPPLLMRRLYDLFTHEGEMVLDCFNGAGTSTLVAKQMQRRFIGIEISKRFHNLATKRHERLALGEDPFSKHARIPGVKNSVVQRLPKQRYDITKKILQLEVKQIAGLMGHLPTYDDVSNHTVHPLEYFDNYFVSWGEVCAAARTTGMVETQVALVGNPGGSLEKV